MWQFHTQISKLAKVTEAVRGVPASLPGNLHSRKPNTTVTASKKQFPLPSQKFRVLNFNSDLGFLFELTATVSGSQQSQLSTTLPTLPQS